MGRKKQHVVPYNDKWAIKADDAARPSKTFDTKVQAMDYGKSLAKAQKTELVIHNADGKISNSNSYGNDPCPPRDKKH